MHYYNSVIKLMGATITVQLSSLVDFPSQWLIDESPQTILSNAVVCFETLIRLYCLRYNVQWQDPFVFQPLITLKFIHQKDVADNNINASDLQAILLTLTPFTQGFCYLGRDYSLTQTPFQSVKSSMREKDMQVLNKFVRLDCNERAGEVQAKPIYSSCPHQHCGGCRRSVEATSDHAA
jgi:hypothetical protein